MKLVTPELYGGEQLLVDKHLLLPQPQLLAKAEGGLRGWGDLGGPAEIPPPASDFGCDVNWGHLLETSLSSSEEVSQKTCNPVLASPIVSSNISTLEVFSALWTAFLKNS